MEVTLALVIFLMMTMMFAAVFPIVVQQAQAGNHYNQATLLVQHKLDQLRAAGYGAIQNPNGAGGGPSLVSLGVIDPNTATSSGAPYTAYFTGVDNLVGGTGGTGGYFPPGSTGKITTSFYPGSSGNSVLYVTVRIDWPPTATPAGYYSGSTMVIQMTHA